MSTDYYLVCETKKTYMPIFTMVLDRCSLSSKNWMFDFIMLCGGEKVTLEHENSPLMDRIYNDNEDIATSWNFLNGWHPHPDDKPVKAMEGK